MSYSMKRSDFSRLLVPHDGSEMSDKALDEAIRFAKHFGSKIILLHVVEDRVAPPSALLAFIKEKATLGKAKADLMGIIRMGGENMLGDRVEKARSAGLEANTMIEVGDPAEVILKTAEKEGADMIIMGSRQLKGARRLMMLGSVARRVAESAGRPFMLIH